MRRAPRSINVKWANVLLLAAGVALLPGCPDDEGSSQSEPSEDAQLDAGGGDQVDSATPTGGDTKVDSGGPAEDVGGLGDDAAGDANSAGPDAADLDVVPSTGDAAADAGPDTGTDAGTEEVPDGAWSAIPDGATPVSEEELAALEENGEWVQVPPDYQERVKTAADEEFAKNLAIVEAYVAEHPELEESLLGDAVDPIAVPTQDGNYRVTVPDGNGGEQTVILDGPKAQIGTIASAIKRYPMLDNQRVLFDQIAPLMPEACASLVPDDAALEALDAAALRDVVESMSTCWWENEMAPLESPAEGAAPLLLPPSVDPEDAESPDSAEGLGSLGNDVSTCNSPTQDWYGSFPHKAYLSTVKNQGNRGTCVSFGTASVMEYLIAQKHKRWVNLSEQSLYAKAKLSWKNVPLGDGLIVGDLFEDLVSSGWSIPFELIWDYNRSTQRLETIPPFYLNSCLGYEGQACSDTTHQGDLICLVPGVSMFCGYYMPENPTGSGWAVSGDYEANIVGMGSSPLIKGLLQSGVPLVASFKITTSWSDVVDGYLGATNWFPGLPIGGHAVHLVAFVPNASLPANRRDSAGGGRYVIKNSWGCAGDNGYLYMPESWFSTQAQSVRGLKVKKKGGNIPPEVEIIQPKSTVYVPYGGLFSSMTLTAQTEDPEDGVDCCTVTWHSSVDGELGAGLSIEPLFSAPGTRVITVTAKDKNGGKSTDSVKLKVYNGAPKVSIKEPAADGATFYKDASVIFVGEATDINQFGAMPCSSFVWTSDQPGDPFPQTGCSVDAAFTTLGSRKLTLTVTDDQGLSATAARAIDVIQAPPGSKPTVTIIEPKPGMLMEPDKFAMAKATAVDGDGDAMTYRWTIQYGSQPETELSTELQFFFKPGTHIPFDCGGNSGTLRFYATDKDGTGEASVEILVNYGPC